MALKQLVKIPRIWKILSSEHGEIQSKFNQFFFAAASVFTKMRRFWNKHTWFCLVTLSFFTMLTSPHCENQSPISSSGSPCERPATKTCRAPRLFPDFTVAFPQGKPATSPTIGNGSEEKQQVLISNILAMWTLPKSINRLRIFKN